MSFDSAQALKSQVKIWASDGVLIGGGVLVHKDTVLTCAHVVGVALGIPEAQRKKDEIPQAPIKVSFLSAASKKIDALVERWDPDDHEDWAVLKLSGQTPVQCRVPTLGSNSAPSYGACNLCTYGFPDLKTEEEYGIWVPTAFEGVNEHHIWQIQSLRSHGVQVQKGFSGCPVWDETNHLVGIVLMAGEEYGLGFILPVGKIVSIPGLRTHFTIPHIAPPKKASVSSKPRRPIMQNRSDWLKGHGLLIDPFSPDSDRAESDPLLKHPQLSFSGYVQPGKFDQIFGNTYIVMSSGGGRTALCKWIKNQSQRRNIDKSDQRTYAIHYSFQRTCNITKHMQAINRIVRNELGGAGPDSSSMQDVVEFIYQLCGQSRYTDLRILVDPGPNSQWDELAKEAELLNAPGVRFHFFPEKNSFHQLMQQLPLDRFQYLDMPLTPELADLALRYRCVACLEPDININAFSLEVLFEPEIRPQVIETFVKIGVQRQSFRDMWRFGNELFKNHLDENGQAAEKSLIAAHNFKKRTKELF